MTTTAPLKLAQITLPLRDNLNRSVADTHKYLQARLLSTYGGYTAHETIGAWQDGETVYHDRSLTYSVAMENHGLNVETFREIAVNAGGMAKQLAVFIVLPCGTVEIVSVG